MVTEIIFEGKKWRDARDLYKGDAPYAEWFKSIIAAFGFCAGLDYLAVDYDDSGCLCRAAGTEFLISPNAAALVLGGNPKARRHGKNGKQKLLNPCI